MTGARKLAWLTGAALAVIASVAMLQPSPSPVPASGIVIAPGPTAQAGLGSVPPNLNIPVISSPMTPSPASSALPAVKLFGEVGSGGDAPLERLLAQAPADVAAHHAVFVEQWFRNPDRDAEERWRVTLAGLAGNDAAIRVRCSAATCEFFSSDAQAAGLVARVPGALSGEQACYADTATASFTTGDGGVTYLARQSC